MPTRFEENEARVEALISSHFTVPAIPGRLELLSIPGIQGWQSSIKYPVTSLVRWVGSDPGTLPSQLKKTCEHFDGSRTPFTWLSGPRCRAAGIHPVLLQAGFKKLEEIAGMLLSLSVDISWHDDSVHTWEITDRMDQRVPRIMAESFRTSDEVAHFYHEAYTEGQGHQRSQMFAAAPRDEKEPLAVAYLSHIPESKAVLMRAGGTLEAHRGKGLYKSLVMRRLKEAKKAGYDYAFVHAYRRTSAPVFARLGFREICALDLYTSKEY